MTRRDGTDWMSGSEKRGVQEKVAAAVSVIRTSQKPASARLEMLEHAVIGAAASENELKNTKSTGATMQYSANTLKMIKEKQTILSEMRMSGSSNSPSLVRWQDRPQALVLLQKAISKAVRAEKRVRVEKLLVRVEEAKEAGDKTWRWKLERCTCRTRRLVAWQCSTRRHTTESQRRRDRLPHQGGETIEGCKEWMAHNQLIGPLRQGKCQFCAMPCRGTREAILRVYGVKRFRSMARHKKSSQCPLRKMAVLLFDLEKAFD